MTKSRKYVRRISKKVKRPKRKTQKGGVYGENLSYMPSRKFNTTHFKSKNCFDDLLNNPETDIKYKQCNSILKDIFDTKTKRTPVREQELNIVNQTDISNNYHNQYCKKNSSNKNFCRIIESKYYYENPLKLITNLVKTNTPDNEEKADITFIVNCKIKFNEWIMCEGKYDINYLIYILFFYIIPPKNTDQQIIQFNTPKDVKQQILQQFNKDIIRLRQDITINGIVRSEFTSFDKYIKDKFTTNEILLFKIKALTNQIIPVKICALFLKAFNDDNILPGSPIYNIKISNDNNINIIKYDITNVFEKYNYVDSNNPIIPFLHARIIITFNITDNTFTIEYILIEEEYFNKLIEQIEKCSYLCSRLITIFNKIFKINYTQTDMKLFINYYKANKTGKINIFNLLINYENGNDDSILSLNLNENKNKVIEYFNNDDKFNKYLTYLLRQKYGITNPTDKPKILEEETKIKELFENKSNEEKLDILIRNYYNKNYEIIPETTEIPTGYYDSVIPYINATKPHTNFNKESDDFNDSSSYTVSTASLTPPDSPLRDDEEFKTDDAETQQNPTEVPKYPSNKNMSAEPVVVNQAPKKGFFSRLFGRGGKKSKKRKPIRKQKRTKKRRH